MGDVLFEWPRTAVVERRIPKDRFYSQGTVSPSVKDKFVSEVARITWTHKLSHDTIHVSGVDDLVEIDIFRIDTKEGVLSNSVLAAIDRAIPRPVIFEVTRPTAELGSGNATIRMVAAHKQLKSGTQKLSNYFTTNWMSLDHDRELFPNAINMQVLYASLLEPLTPMEIKTGDSMSDVATKLEVIRRLDREITTLERKLRTEVQFNRKVEIRRQLKAKQAQREQQR